MTRPAGRGQDTRTRILEIAQDAIIAKGFDATSIEEIVAAVEITKGGFFYHFPDKNALARALIERHIETEAAILDDLDARAAELSDDPLQRVLIMLRLLAELLQDMPNGYPGCIVASAAYQDRLFDAEVRATNRRAVLAWRERMRAHLDAVAAHYPPHEPVDLEAVADFVNTVLEGGIVAARALGEPHMIVGQILLARQYVKLLFAPR